MLMRRLSFYFLTLLFLLMVVDDLYAVVSSPRIHALTQPDGSKFYARQWGDEWLHGLETLEGYTTVKDETGYYFYAEKDTSGRLIPTTVKADESPPSGLQKRLRPLMSISRKTAIKSRQIPAFVVPPTGTANMPVILINFNDTTTTFTVANFDSLLFGNTPSIATGPGSMKDYYEEVSYGLFSISAGPSGVAGWYTSANDHDYYGYFQGFDRAAALAREAVLAADTAGFNFSQYDSDSDGKVDVVAIVHQGMGAEESWDGNDIWSHRWSFSDAGVGTVTADGKTVDDYIIMPEKSDSDSISTIGVFAHEYGHALGLPDLYDTDGTSEGIGNWGLMGGGSWNYTVNPGDTPAHMMAWSKWYLGWLTPTQIIGSLDNQSISAVENTPVAYYCPANTNGVDWIFDTSSGTGEYFLIENRQQTGFDAGLPGSGLAIWQIAEYAPYDNTANENEDGVRLVDLKEADGDDDLDNGTNRGDSGDLFPGSSNNTSFYAGTTPAAEFYDGSDSSLIVTGISSSGLTMTASLECGSDVSLVIDSTTVDDSSGNNNGYADPGENVLLNITLKNVSGTTTGISGILSTTDPYVTIVSNTSSYPDLAYNESGDSITPYQLRVSASTPDFRNVSLSLTINANSGTYSVTRNFSILILGGTSGILFVDDDGGDSYESAYEDALNANGYSYVTWDISSLLNPPVGKMSPQPSSVIWFTGDAISDTLTSTDQTNLAEYLDDGGTLFLSSQGVLSDSELEWGDDTFTTEYIKVSSGKSDIVLGTASVEGVSNDPITNGLNLTLTRTLTGDDYYYSVPTPDIQDLADEVRPDLTVATPIFTNPNNGDLSSAMRYPTSGSTTYKVVFLAFPFEAIDNSSGARNTLMQKIIEWLRPDTTPPAQVTNLSGATGSKEGEVTLTWTAPGDDGTSGTATSYIIRRSTVSITSSNWATSSDVSGEPTPSMAGTTESVTLSGLPGGQNYYFALKALDEENNASAVSNSVQATVQRDMTVPSSVSDLTAALGSNPGEVVLSWTAPGDDGNVGKASSYDVRYLASSAISASNWATATAVTSGEPTPAIVGSSESMTVSGLVDNTTYYFALKTKDDLNNTSNISNSPSILMPDTTPPPSSAISNFTATAGDGQVTLSWTWNTGTGATGLVIVVGTDTSPMALSEGIQLDRVLSPNTSYTHSGLTNGKTYYYSAFAFDDNENFSSAVTSSGVTPGAGGGGGGGGCFIATAAYGTPMCDEVVSLCSFRDRYLMTNLPGRIFVKTYYKVSPPIAGFISEREYLKKFMRAALKPVISFVKSSQ